MSSAYAYKWKTIFKEKNRLQKLGLKVSKPIKAKNKHGHYVWAIKVTNPIKKRYKIW